MLCAIKIRIKRSLFPQIFTKRLKEKGVKEMRGKGFAQRYTEKKRWVTSIKKGKKE
jgi:hypothetical protein